ncbi:unnamed protein product [Strongylus vulgaris]|uniref:Uncharacterized protein n=1 Tax=Strongylus vulgaris TaxID=40348 RepID=A0A3P7K4K5_STRVU|nr:unnamed protein product [Strongylus vulgaris]
MPDDGIICFQNPRLPLLIKSGVTRHWMSNLSDRKLNYKARQYVNSEMNQLGYITFQITIENPDSCFSIDPGQVSGEIAGRGHISLIITRKVSTMVYVYLDKYEIDYIQPGVGKDDKMIIEYTGELNGKTIVRMVPVA